MATAAQSTAQDTGTGNGNGQSDSTKQARAVVPFIRASGLHREVMFDITRAMTSADQDLGVFDIPAYGYLRSVVLHVDLTGGASDGTTNDIAATQDSPFDALKSIAVQEPNGSTIAQYNDGFDLYLCNKYGGYRYGNDPKNSPNYSLNVGTGDTAEGSFLLRIPFELNERDGLGSLPNQNSAANFKLRLTLAKIADVFSGAVATAPTARIRAYVETWDQPPPSTGGQTNQVTPPAVNTTQYWTPQSHVINAGEQSPRLTRMGNYIRNLIFVFRNSSGARTDDWPSPTSLFLDARPKDTMWQAAWEQTIYERYGYGQEPIDDPGGRDTGVWPYDFCHEFDGQVGHENRDLWLPTLGSTRLELQGNFPTAGTLYILTNDVSIAGVVFM